MRLSRSRITSAHSSFHSLRAKRSSSSLRNSSARNEPKYMPANRFIALVKNRPRIQQRFDRAEDIFDHPQLFVLQRHLTRREIHARRQHPLAVVARSLLDLVLVNGEL